MGMAAYYSKNLARETLKGMKENAYKGWSNGGNTPYGYKLVPRLDEFGRAVTNKKGAAVKHIVIDPERAEAVKIMFNMLLESRKRFEIIERLDELGYKRADGANFTGTSIDNLLRNRKYTGKYYFYYNKKRQSFDPLVDRILVTDEYPAIISEELYNSVQAILAQRIHRTPSNANENYLLTGKIVCGECGENYRGLQHYKKGYEYVFYKCSEQTTYKNGRQNDKRCRNNSVRRDDLEKYIIKQIKKMLFKEDLIDLVMDEYSAYAREATINNSLIDLLENQIKDIETQINNIINAIATTGQSNQILLDKLTSLEETKKSYQSSLEKEQQGGSYKFATKDEIRKAYLKAQDILENGEFIDQKALLNNFINKVIVYKDRVELFINVVPLSISASLDISIENDDFIRNDGSMTVLDRDSTDYMYMDIDTLNDSKKDEHDSSFCLPNSIRQKFVGSTNQKLPNKNSETNIIPPNNTTLEPPCQPNIGNKKKFAWLDGKVYCPRRYHKGQLLTRKERLWLFMTIRIEIEKSKMLNLKFVKHSSK